ncbi:hypothetical protein BJY01DRAFT_210799, partial [Aspergillus pseudoustus]
MGRSMLLNPDLEDLAKRPCAFVLSCFASGLGELLLSACPVVMAGESLTSLGGRRGKKRQSVSLSPTPRLHVACETAIN